MKKRAHGKLPKDVLVCPNCGKPGFEEYMPFRPGMEHKCKFCGHVGPLRLMEKEE